MTQGFQIPIQTVAEQHGHRVVQGRRAQAARDAADYRRQHRHHAHHPRERQPDFSRAVNGNPSINTQRAETQVQVADGVTTVIGGILQTQRDAARIDQTPGVSSIPLLGWLFKRTDTQQREPGARDLHHSADHPRIADADAMILSSVKVSRMRSLGRSLIGRGPCRGAACAGCTQMQTTASRRRI